MKCLKAKSFLVLFTAVNLLFNGQSILAQSSSINTVTNWDGVEYIVPWGSPGSTPTYGQIITPTSSQLSLRSFSFNLSAQSFGAPPQFTARVYEWNNSIGTVNGGALFTSNTLTAPDVSSFTEVNITTGGVRLNEGQQYVLLFTTLGQPATSNSYQFGALEVGTYSGGRAIYSNDTVDINSPWDGAGSFMGWNLAFIAEFGPSSADTLASALLNSAALRNTFNLQSAKTAQGLTYDCTVFDAQNICVSFAGTRSYGNDGIDNTTGALIIAHQPTANIRVGAYVDQNIGTTDSMGLKVKRGSPGYGAFGVWSQRTDGLGTQVRAAANSGSVDIETTRQAIGTAEAGFGQSNIKSNGVQLELSQGYAANDKVIVRPYVGYRQMTNKRAAYTELTSDSVFSPLTYSALKQTTESVLLGSKFFARLTPKTTLNSNFGFEYNVKTTVDSYQAVSADIGTIDPINMSSNVKKARPVFSVGVVHALDKTQTVGFSLTHRKEALASSSTWSAYTTYGMLQYSAGF